MYSVALVQNQSEMAHYAYADARPLLEGHDVQLITGDNIGALPSLLARLQVDALVIGSNALNDRDILRELNNKTTARGLADFLDAGRGVLCMQQLGLAMRAGPTLECLPDPLGDLRPEVARDEPPGELAIGSGAARHVALTYPHAIDIAEVQARAAGFKSLPGLYWHYLAGGDLCDWDELIVDRSGTTQRPLVLAAKQSGARRVVVSALPLDWQKQEELFANLLVYVIEGRHNLATVHPPGEEDADYHYLRESLRAQRVAFGDYGIPDDADRAASNVERGIHSTLLFAPGMSVDDLPEGLRGTVGEAVRGGRLRLVQVGDGAFKTRSMRVVSRELRPQRLLEVTELQIQTELRAGYIDDSFWSHVETLQTLETLPRPDLAGSTVDYSKVQDEAWKIVKNHERKGSYDEVFGPTCALYWLRGQYLGTGSPEAQRTAEWLREALPRYDPDDRALAYLAFGRLGALTDDDRKDLQTAASALAPDVSETTLVQYLRACLVGEQPAEVIASLSRALVGAQGDDGTWIDLTTTATAATALLYARAVLDEAGSEPDLVAHIDAAALAAVVHILRQLARSEASARPHPYPWDGKASTTVKCLQAWLKFDELQDLPVFDLIEGLRRSDSAATQYASSRTALGVLQETNEENAALRNQEAATRAELEAERETTASQSRALTIWRIAAGTAGFLLYVAVALLIAALVNEEDGFGDVLKSAIVDGWPFHTVFAAPLLLWVVRAIRRRGKDETASS
ncbi:MAG: hypothetical protein M3340_19250 [Actinomycetota bacterium]|nr:hypothetical protein [Actinomycetota bacterium]